MKKVISFAATPQNLLKITAIDKAFKKYRKEVKHIICHAGNEEDERTSLSSFVDLDFPRTNHYIAVGFGSHAAQTARTMLEVEKVLLEEEPDLVILSGHQDATLACGITASKMQIPIAHIDAGLRSYEKYNPEEINRILTDVLCEYHFVSEHSAMKNLRDEGENSDKIFFTGNTLVDVLEMYWSDMEESDVLNTLNLGEDNYVLATFHHKENLEKKQNLTEITEMIKRLSKNCKVIWLLPGYAHKKLLKKGLDQELSPGVLLSGPLPYIDFLALMYNAEVVITDSEGIQEETTYLGAQCITVRKYTERIVTLEVGTNQLVGFDFEKAEKLAEDVLKGILKPGRIPEMWDGKAAKRIVDVLIEEMD
ncbi:MAG: UDP-N-acetylglucosamine 2-epimerase (non-hydrolyzing) [Bacteroidales bacterium]|nr:UDP-N-acetylglucosamine 2-epimerase (non-hydrolyzing) [Bacteroidales bacterium]